MAPHVSITIAGDAGLSGFATGDHITAQVVRQGEGNCVLFHCIGVKLGDKEMAPIGFSEEVVVVVSFDSAGGAAKNVSVVYYAFANAAG